ncbi:MAG: hypothetical protein A3J97_11950 [Spirochaetes bacterium RIFOXYC1_FULL_54_7]|nr:MAG: hypothetical protein A3J97_11950 [Spirochaetes bacterium RIFOXYC1_FULL_54_7]
MRIALVVAPAGSGNSLSAHAEAMAKGMGSMGHRVDSFDARTDDGARLPAYEYILILSEPVSAFSGKIPECVTKIFKNASSLIGKKSGAFLRNSGLFSGKAMTNLMLAMEKEGMHINWSEQVGKAEEAGVLSKKIGA